LHTLFTPAGNSLKADTMETGREMYNPDTRCILSPSKSYKIINLKINLLV